MSMISARASFLSAAVLAALALLPGAVPAGAAEDALNVVASIKPIHSLVAGVMEGVGAPVLIVQGAASPHTYSLRPSDARALERADVIFWVGEGLETFLERPLAALARRATVVELAVSPRITLLPNRTGGTWEPHRHGAEPAEAEHDDGHDEEHGGHEHGEHGTAAYDGHVWLDPANAKAIVAVAAEALSARDPAHAAVYAANAGRLTAALTALDAELAATLAPVAAKPYVVFHDAYQYFEVRYGLASVGAITLSPERAPSARRLVEIRNRIAELRAVCVFAEPQFEPAVVDTVIEGTGARRGVLDPEGAALTDGPALYFELLRNLAASLTGCLTASRA